MQQACDGTVAHMYTLLNGSPTPLWQPCPQLNHRIASLVDECTAALYVPAARHWYQHQPLTAARQPCVTCAVMVAAAPTPPHPAHVTVGKGRDPLAAPVGGHMRDSCVALGHITVGWLGGEGDGFGCVSLMCTFQPCRPGWARGAPGQASVLASGCGFVGVCTAVRSAQQVHEMRNQKAQLDG